MSQPRCSYHQTKPSESLSDLNLYFLWPATSESHWSATVKEECQAALNQPVEEEKTSSNVGMTIMAVLTTLALLGAAWAQAPRLAQAYKEVAALSGAELLTLMAY